MEPGKRFKIDVSDESHPVVWINIERPPIDVALAVPAILRKLIRWHRERTRAALAPVEELVEDGSEVQAATGTDNAADVVARKVRRTFSLVRP